MESFFHLIIWLAIQYLPHNCVDVPGFVANYFEAYTLGQDPTSFPSCGWYKMSVMQSGIISTGTLERLTFYCKPNPLPSHSTIPEADPVPSPSRSRQTHPINAIINTLLSKFRSRYTLLAPPRERPQLTANIARPIISDRKELSQLLDAHIDDPTTSTTSGTLGDLAVLSKDVRDLEDHSSFVVLIAKYAIESEWPSSDKTEPQLLLGEPIRGPFPSSAVPKLEAHP
jgi:hypothetical protein